MRPIDGLGLGLWLSLRLLLRRLGRFQRCRCFTLTSFSLPMHSIRPRWPYQHLSRDTFWYHHLLRRCNRLMPLRARFRLERGFEAGVSRAAIVFERLVENRLRRIRRQGIEERRARLGRGRGPTYSAMNET